MTRPRKMGAGLDAARRFALSLPEATEEPHFDMFSFRIKGKIFATVPPDEVHLNVFLDESDIRAAIADDETSFEELWWGKKLVGVRVDVSTADPELVTELLEEAWRRKAPKRVAAEFSRTGRSSSEA